MSVGFPLGTGAGETVPFYYGVCDWSSAGKNRNGVFYVGDTVTVARAFHNAPAAVKGATFETGVAAQIIRTTDPGSVTVFDHNSGSPVTYDSTHAHRGTLSAKLAGADNGMTWNLPSVTDHYGRLYVYMDANPSGDQRGPVVSPVVMKILQSGKMFLQSADGAHLLTTTNTVNLGSWFRIEYHFIHDTVNGFAELKLFNSPESLTPTETITSPIAWNTGGAQISQSYGVQQNGGNNIWLDDIIANATSYPGPTSVTDPAFPSFNYLVRDYYGNTVSSGSYTGTVCTPTPPAGGWKPGWYRVYFTGSQTDTLFGDSYGATNFCVIKANANFVTMPAATVSGNPGGAGEVPDLVMKGVMGAGTSRLTVTDTVTGAGDTVTVAAANAARSRIYWPDTDAARPRPLWTNFDHLTVDVLALPGAVSGTYLNVYCATPAVSGATTFVTLAAGSVSGRKITVSSPNNSTVVETYDNLVDATAAVAALAASAYVKVFAGGSATGGTQAVTAVGNVYQTATAAAVATLYAAGVTRFEGPQNEPPGNAETTHKMRLFQAWVHAGNASAKAIGPSTVDYAAFIGFLNAGGGAYCDELATHLYNAETSSDLNLGRTTLQAVKDAMTANGVASKALWQTESTGAVFTSVYRVFHPRRARRVLLQTLLLDQYGIPKERNNPWYDVNHGFWDFPAWLENADGSLNPQVALLRTLAEEIYGKSYVSALDFGTPGNNIFLGNVYGTTDRVVAVMATSFIDNCSVTFTTDAASLVAVDGFGNESTLTAVAGLVALPLTDVPSYLRVPNGVNVSVYSCNDWPKIKTAGQGLSASSLVHHATVGTVNTPIPVDGGFITAYNGTNPGVYAPSDALPENATMSWENAVRADRLIIWSGSAWQNQTALVDFDVQTTTDGTNWVTQRTVTKPTPTSFLFGTDGTAAGCQRETFWDEQWVFDVKLPIPVRAKGIRLVVRATSFGGAPDQAALDTGGDQGGTQHITLQDIAVLCDDNTIPRYATVT